uniref:Uncharacterized protein n=1 Tax=Rhizophora mucronata TaxID=61149 RepID=A0A2P2PUS8_RHIMU
MEKNILKSNDYCLLVLINQHLRFCLDNMLSISSFLCCVILLPRLPSFLFTQLLFFVHFPYFL